MQMKIQKPYLNSLSSGYYGVMAADIFLVTVEDSSKENECSYQRQTALVIVKQNARLCLYVICLKIEYSTPLFPVSTHYANEVSSVKLFP